MGHSAKVCFIGRMKIAVLFAFLLLIFSPAQAGQNTRTSPTFMGYACTRDCSGHRAGYEWAEKHAIVDLGDCTGRSRSFVEGCQAWVREHSEVTLPELGDSGEIR